MPAYDKPMNITARVDAACKAAEPARQVAAVLSFNSHDVDRIKGYLNKLVDAGIIDRFEVGTYHAIETSPTLYFP